MVALAALIPLVVSFLGEAAPWLVRRVAGDDAGDVAGRVVDVVRDVTGLDDPAEALAAARENADALRQVRLRLAELDAELERAYLADRQDARARDVALVQSAGRNLRGDVLAVLIVAGVLATIGVLLFAPIPEGGGRDALLLLAGALVNAFAAVVQFEFGSSRGSKDKDGALARLGRP